MKTDKISFGQTFIRPSLIKYMTPQNKGKMPYIYGLGELYPADVYVGSTPRGELTLDIIHSTPAKQLFFSEEIPKTVENVLALNFIHNFECSQRIQNGIKTPVYRVNIPNIESMSIKELQIAVNDKIKYYYETFAKNFLN